MAIVVAANAMLQPPSLAKVGVVNGIFAHRYGSSPVGLPAATNPPTVEFTSLRHYSRLTGQVSVSVEANDDDGIDRVELYVDGGLIGTQNVVPNIANATVSFNWNSATASNGKHMIHATAFDSEGNNESAFAAVRIMNAPGSVPAPTATLVATPLSIPFGQISTLTWVTTNASSVMINQSIGSVAPVGTRVVNPGGSTTYTLTAANAAGSVTKSVTINVGAPSGNVIALAPAIRHQTMEGWEATAETGMWHSSNWNNYKNALFDAAVNDLGINRVRLEVRSNVENNTDWFALWRSGQITQSQWGDNRYSIVNDNSSATTMNPNGFKWSEFDDIIDNVVLPMKQRVEARGEQLWINVNYVDFDITSFEHHQNPAEYAEFVLAVYQHMQTKYGFVPHTWEVMLEPDNDTGWFVNQFASVIKPAGDRLVANGFTPRFVVPSTVSISPAGPAAYMQRIAQTPGAMQYVDTISYHRYRDVNSTNLQAIRNLASTHNKKTAMLEWIGADYHTLHEDLKTMNNSSWQQFVLSYLDAEPDGTPIPDNGAQHYRINNASSTFALQSRSKFLRQYFKYVRGGAQRIEALTGNSNFDPVAFINTNGKYAVVVKASSGGTFNVHGLPAGLYGIKYTTASQYNIDRPDATITLGQSLSANIPAAGVITIYGK